MLRCIFVLIVLLPLTACGQIPDKSFNPRINNPVYDVDQGPVVCLDEGHNNFHTLDNRFWAFGELLRRDGYVVESTKMKFTADVLHPCSILVIANAQLEGEWDTYPYPTPSAFSPEEISSVQNWVQEGGALLLIADHMPLAGVAQALASAFNIEFNNGFALKGYKDESERDTAFEAPTIFRIKDQTLAQHTITEGRTSDESISYARSFTGQAFQAPATAEPILILPQDFISLMPEKAWQFGPDTKKIPVGGWLQGAVMKYGVGRTAFFGEAAMFTAQLSDLKPVGMNAPQAEQNAQFVLNLMHWLSGILK
jgi:hypothetical protein